MRGMEHQTPAFAALDAFPALRAAVEPGLRLQRARVAACLARFQARPQLHEAVTFALDDPRGGLVVLEGQPGSGVTSLLCAVAAGGPRPLWLAGDAPGDVASLYAQLVALRRPMTPLLDPTAATDPAALEGLLAEVVAQGRERLVLLIDDLEPPRRRLRPGPTPLPAELPPGVTLLLGAAPDAYLPYPARTRIALHDDAGLRAAQRRALAALGCDPAWVEPICAASGGNFFFLGSALGMLRAGLLAAPRLPAGLDALLRVWWDALDPRERRIAALLAAVGEPLPLPLLVELCGQDPRLALARWARLGLVEIGALALSPADEEEGAGPTVVVGFSHSVLAATVVGAAPELLEQAHGDLAAAGMRRAERERAAGRGGTRPMGDAMLAYLDRQLGRHLAHAAPALRATALPRLVDRERLLWHERQASQAVALDETRWELRAAAAGSELRIARAAVVAGIVATWVRMLSPEAAAEALEAGLEAGGREIQLRRVLAIVERLPDGHTKALILRRLGEVCYQQRMRSSAMRLLSRALDLEAAPTSRAWRDSRDALLAALASAALELGATEQAIAIGERIEHLERRAHVETQIVRALLAAGERDRAQRLARGILHESMGAWARAEAGVSLLRAGDQRGLLLLDELGLETVSAWAQIELACDEVAQDEAAARRRIDALPSQGQRDRGLARLARVLAAADNDAAALAAAEAIVEVDVRVAALIELRLSLEGLVAMLALERATSDIGGVSGDDRAPLVAALAAALAAIGRRDKALDLAQSLPAGEGRDRALSRVAVGLGQRGEHEAARELLTTVDDEDERGWAYEELAKLLAAGGRWGEAIVLVRQIAADDQRAKALADLAVAQARAGQPFPALAVALGFTHAVERARALTLIAPALVASGAAAEALAVAQGPEALATSEARSRYVAAVVAALVERGELETALDVVVTLRRPADRARAGALLARALAARNPALARPVLGATLRSAAVGRDEAFRAMELAAPAFAVLGGADLLAAIAAMVDEVDRWV